MSPDRVRTAERPILPVMIHTMVFFIFAPLLFLILRLTVRWRWRTVFLVAIVLSVVADFVLDGLVARRR
jgi:phosphatidylglycerophosphate synthase